MRSHVLRGASIAAAPLALMASLTLAACSADACSRPGRREYPQAANIEAAFAAARAVDAVKIYGTGETAVRALNGLSVEFEREAFSAKLLVPDEYVPNWIVSVPVPSAVLLAGSAAVASVCRWASALTSSA